MRIAVFGVGGVGGYFGGKLAHHSGHELIFIARGAHLEAIREHGLHVQEPENYFVARPALATDDPEQVGPVDLILVATKAWQVHEAAEQMRPMLGPDTVIIPLLNGVEAPEQLAEHLGEKHVLGGFCRVMSQIEAPGKISQGGTPPYVAFGELQGAESARVAALRVVFVSAGIAVQPTPNIRAAMWQKLLFIASFGGIGAVSRATAGQIKYSPATYEMLWEAMAEVKQVARARKIAMAADALEQGIRFFDSLPYDATASMQRDIMEGRPSELEAQNGAVLRLGAEVNVDAPVHRLIYASLIPAERKARGELA